MHPRDFRVDGWGTLGHNGDMMSNGIAHRGDGTPAREARNWGGTIMMSGKDIIPQRAALRIRDVAHLLSLSRRTVERMIERGDLAAINIGTGTRPAKRVRRDSLVELMQRRGDA